MMAALTAGLGAIPLIMMLSPVGPHGLFARVVAIVIAACCAAMALRWSRPHWPTPTESAVFVVVGTLCIAAMCAIVTDPLAGLFGCFTFVLLAGYTAIVSTAPFLVFNLLAAAMTAIVLAAEVATDDAALALCALILIAVLTTFMVFGCRMVIGSIGKDTLHTQIEPLTGLLDRGAFDEAASTLLAARNRDDDRYLALIVVGIDGYQLLATTDGRSAGDQARVSVANTLRANVRYNAIVAHIEDTEFLIADTFTGDPSPLVERILSALRTSPSRLTASIGVVSTPLPPLTEHPPHAVLHEVITIATGAMYDARKAGGDRAHHVKNPPLAVSGQSSTDH